MYFKIINSFRALKRLINKRTELSEYVRQLEIYVATRLELMFERAEQRSMELERNYSLLDCWKRRGDDLLYSMIPRSVADRLRTEKNSLNTCQVRP
jgi:hypothetical protein